MTAGTDIHQQTLNRKLVEEEIIACENEATRLASLLEENRQARMALNEKLNSTALINSVVPRDVMVEIFSIIREDQVQQGSFISLPTPFFLGHVCKAWRTFTRETPCLWSTIAIELSESNHQAQFSMMQESLSLARSRKLDIYIRSGTIDPTIDFFQPLLMRCAQWRIFDSVAFRSLSMALSSRRYYFPSLQTLVLNERFRWPANERDAELLGYDFTRTAHIENATFRIHGKISDKEPLIAWHQVRFLTLETMMGKELLDILRRLVNIESLTLKLSSNEAEEEQMTELNQSCRANGLIRHALPRLSRLTVVDKVWYTTIIVSAVEAPILKCLEVESARQDAFWLLRQTFTSVEELVIRNLALMAVGRLICSFRSFLSLTTLVITGGRSFELCDRLINHLNPAMHTTGGFDEILPNLIRLEYFGRISFSLDVMTTMLQNRLSSSRKYSWKGQDLKALKSFNIKYTNGKWIQDITATDPNALASFYTEIIRLSTLGTTLNLRWEKSYEQRVHHIYRGNF